jgi:hypothetical protein
MDIPACLRHITRSLAYVSCIHASGGGGGLGLTDDGETWCGDGEKLKM